MAAARTPFMPSIIPGYEYDLFVSYRQNDNARGWVTEFVNNLREELASTLKDPVSVYFDANPHDGLLETHHVDKSLEGKLKSFIFLPIVSQTYCDPKSYAWQNELQPFNRMCQQDTRGREIRLASGNVASRILPVRIHDLDAEDRTMLEAELGGAIRSIEFIYKSSGVNRPLTPADNPEKNQNKTYYRDQINKVANAVKELIYAIRYPDRVVESFQQAEPAKGNTPAQDSKPKTTADPNTIAVLPFVNLSQDPSQEYFADGVMENILIELASLRQLKVISRTSVMRYRKTDKTAPQIAAELGVKYILEGSAQAHGNKVRIHVQLIDAHQDQPVWAKAFRENLDDIFAIQSNVAEFVAAELKASLLEAERPAHDAPTRNLKAYDLFLKGRHAFNQWNLEGYRQAEKYFLQALAEDPEFTQAYSYLASTYSALMSWNGDLTPNESLAKIKQYLPEAMRRGATDNDYLTEGFVEFFINKNLKAAEEKLLKAMEIGPNNANVYYTYSYVLSMMGRPEDALRMVEKAKVLDPTSVSSFNYQAIALYLMKRYDEAKTILREAIRLYPIVIRLFDHLARVLVTTGEYEEALRVIDQGLKMGPVRPPSMVAYGCRAWMGLKHVERAKTLVDELVTRSLRMEKGVNVYVAHAFAALGDPEAARQYLDKAKETNDVDLIWLQVDPLLNHLVPSTASAPDYAGAEKAILQRLESGLPKTLLYHNLDHIRDVVNAAERIGPTENLSVEEMRLLRIAAWLHDAGLTISLSDHEQRGCLLARQLLPNYGFSELQVESVCGMILATKIPQSPKTPSERVLCDADLDYLGRDDFFEVGRRLFDELVLLGKLANETEWNRLQQQFLGKHHYHTAWAKANREPVKNIHLQQLSDPLNQ